MKEASYNRMPLLSVILSCKQLIVGRFATQSSENILIYPQLLCFQLVLNPPQFMPTSISIFFYAVFLDNKTHVSTCAVLGNRSKGRTYVHLYPF